MALLLLDGLCFRLKNCCRVLYKWSEQAFRTLEKLSEPPTLILIRLDPEMLDEDKGNTSIYGGGDSDLHPDPDPWLSRKMPQWVWEDGRSAWPQAAMPVFEAFLTKNMFSFWLSLDLNLIILFFYEVLLITHILHFSAGAISPVLPLIVPLHDFYNLSKNSPSLSLQIQVPQCMCLEKRLIFMERMMLK